MIRYFASLLAVALLIAASAQLNANSGTSPHRGMTVGAADFSRARVQAIPGTHPQSYSDMTRELRHLCATRKGLSIVPLGLTSRGTTHVLLVSAARPGTNPALADRLLVICRQHGDEPASTEAAMQFLRKSACHMRAGLVVYLVPMANPEGADALQRFNGSGQDLNRDWGVFRSREVRALYSAVRRIKPALVLDLHSWTDTDSFQGNSTEVARDAGTSNGQLAARFQREIGNRLTKTMGNHPDQVAYSPEANLTLCHRFLTSRCGVAASLVETKPTHMGKADMASAVRMDLAVIEYATHMALPPRPLLATGVALNPFMDGNARPAPRHASLGRHDAALSLTYLKLILLVYVGVMAAFYLLVRRTPQSPGARPQLKVQPGPTARWTVHEQCGGLRTSSLRQTRHEIAGDAAVQRAA